MVAGVNEKIEALRLQDTGLVRALTDLFADLADLLQKELQLAKTEITEKIVWRLRASAWMVIAGVLGIVAVLLLIEAAVFGIASFGIALHWSCLIVAGVLIAAAAAFRAGRVPRAFDWEQKKYQICSRAGRGRLSHRRHRARAVRPAGVHVPIVLGRRDSIGSRVPTPCT
jgi:hypothetical protein